MYLLEYIWVTIDVCHVYVYIYIYIYCRERERERESKCGTILGEEPVNQPPPFNRNLGHILLRLVTATRVPRSNQNHRVKRFEQKVDSLSRNVGCNIDNVALSKLDKMYTAYIYIYINVVKITMVIDRCCNVPQASFRNVGPPSKWPIFMA